jgi:type VI secretion system VasD/TssJ family lipoprotein
MSRSIRFRSLLLALLVAAVAGCFSSSRSVEVRGVSPLNVNVSTNESVSVLVHFYLLRSPTAFQRTDYQLLWNDPEQVKKLLGDDVIGWVEATIDPQPPGAPAQRINLGAASGDAAWIGIMPRFRGNDGRDRTMVVAGDRIESMTIELTGYHIRDAAAIDAPARR